MPNLHMTASISWGVIYPMMRKGSTALIGALFSTVLAVGLIGPVPGYYSANQVGSCHGVFGNYFGTVLRPFGAIVSSEAPVGQSAGQYNAVGSCPYQGTPAPVFPPGSSAAGTSPNSP